MNDPPTLETSPFSPFATSPQTAEWLSMRESDPLGAPTCIETSIKFLDIFVSKFEFDVN